MIISVAYKMFLINYLTSCIIFFIDDSDDDDILTIKRKNIDIVDIPITEKDNKVSNKKKLVTKVALAKKILRKNIIPNKKTTFDDEGQVSIVCNFIKLSQKLRINLHTLMLKLIKVKKENCLKTFKLK